MPDKDAQSRKRRRKKIIFIGVLVLVLIFIDILSILLYLQPSSFNLNPQSSTSTAQVKEIIDGDTLKLDNGNYVRLIGISASKSPQESFDESRNFLALLIQGRTVKLEKDTQDKDNYNQLLRYVYVDLYGKQLFVNEESVKQGYSVPLSVEPNTKYKSILDEARIYCLENKLNMCA